MFIKGGIRRKVIRVTSYSVTVFRRRQRDFVEDTVGRHITVLPWGIFIVVLVFTGLVVEGFGKDTDVVLLYAWQVGYAVIIVF